VVVGDVSGRGLHAATTMAGLRHAIRAYVADGDDVAAVLTKLNGVLSFETEHRFATVLAAEVDVERRRITMASAGHFLPLLVTVEGADFLQAPVEPPVGVDPLSPSAVSFDVPEKAMLLAFTDGLIERKGEDIDAGLGRLRRACATRAESLDEFVDGVVSGLGANDADDDVVLLALRWSS
jgi:serine phosphatase RsbU (regulator of sigma subunit)